MKRTKRDQRKRIQKRIRKKISGTSALPRLSIFRSNKEIYCQIIDDVNGVTLASASSMKNKKEGTKSDQAKVVGKEIAEKALAENISSVVFDRSGYLYHGRVKSLAEGAREAGLKF